MNQQEIWNQIAPEWDEYKKIPAEHTIEFLKKTSEMFLIWEVEVEDIL